MIQYIVDRENKVIEILAPVSNGRAVIDLAGIYPDYKLKIV